VTVRVWLYLGLVATLVLLHRNGGPPGAGNPV
jgi:hypothetical protein